MHFEIPILPWNLWHVLGKSLIFMSQCFILHEDVSTTVGQKFKGSYIKVMGATEMLNTFCCIIFLLL